jgi:hypothetical protein
MDSQHVQSMQIECDVDPYDLSSSTARDSEQSGDSDGGPPTKSSAGAGGADLSGMRFVEVLWAQLYYRLSASL